MLNRHRSKALAGSYQALKSATLPSYELVGNGYIGLRLLTRKAGNQASVSVYAIQGGAVPMVRLGKIPGIWIEAVALASSHDAAAGRAGTNIPPNCYR